MLPLPTRARCARLTRDVAVVLGFVALGVATFGLSACSKPELSERPPRSTEAPSFSTESSTLGAQVNIPIGELQSLLEAKLPQRFSGEGNGGDACTKVLFAKVCAGTHYDFEVRRSGPLQLAAAGPSTLHLSLPLAFDGHGGFRGTDAKHLHLDARPFTGALVVDAEITPRIGGVDGDWCPRLDLAMSTRWTSDPKVEIVHGVWVDVRKQVQTKLDERLPELVARAQSAVDCNKFKARLAEIYGSKTYPVQVLNASVEHLNVRPSGIGFSGLKITPTELSATLTLTAAVEIAPQALTPEALPLPPLRTVPATPPRLHVALPVRVPYETLSTAISHALVGKTFEQNTAAGQIKVQVNGVEVYPSQGQLVIGLQVSASTRSLAPDTKGEIYLIATPVIEDGSRISLPDAHYAAVLDSVFWQAASALFENQIKDGIRKAAVYDLGPTLAKGQAALAKSLAQPAASAAGVLIKLNDVNLKLGRIAVADQDFAVEGLLSTSATVEVSH